MPPIKAKSLIFYSTIVYYWLLAIFISDLDGSGESYLYFLYLLPITIFVIINADSLVKRKANKGILVLITYALLVTIISLLRNDFSSILNTLLLVAVLIISFQSDFELSLTFLNSLFLLSIPLSMIATHLGINQFGYIPGKWEGRISLFPGIAESAIFCVLMIALNFFYNRRLYRFIIYGTASYFLIFSGSKTGIILFGIFVIFVLVSRFFSIRNRFVFSSYSFLTVAFFVIFVQYGSAADILIKLNNPTLNKMFFGKEYQTAEEIQLSTSSTRKWIWENHFKIFAKSPIVGVGTFSLADYADRDSKLQYTSSTGSESFVTGIMARYGILALALFYFFLFTQNNAMRLGNHLKYFAILLLFISMIAYGSFIVPYNFLFLLIIFLLGEPDHSNYEEDILSN